MIYREVYRNDELIGWIGQSNNGDKVYTRSTEDSSQKLKILSTIIRPLTLETAKNIGGMSFSEKSIIQITDKQWLFNLNYKVPYNIYLGEVKKIKAKDFKELS